MNQRLLLLPGMDGTGALFADSLKVLPDRLEAETVSYPTGLCLSTAELIDIIRSAAPTVGSFVLVAESFSTPLAIQYAATRPCNLKGLVLCAGFAASPVRGRIRFVCSCFAPILFAVRPPDFVVRYLLLGSKAPASLTAAVQASIASVKRKVLLSRLRIILECDVLSDLDRVTVPILYLQAARDRLIPPSCLEEIRRIKPQIAVAKVAGPHLLLQREPEQTAEIVARFAQQLK